MHTFLQGMRLQALFSNHLLAEDLSDWHALYESTAEEEGQSTPTCPSRHPANAGLATQGGTPCR